MDCSLLNGTENKLFDKKNVFFTAILNTVRRGTVTEHCLQVSRLRQILSFVTLRFCFTEFCYSRVTRPRNTIIYLIYEPIYYRHTDS